MKSKALSIIFLFAGLLFFSPLLNAQNANLSDQQFNDYLKDYVKKLLIQYGEQSLDKERYLVQQIRMINEEIKSRVHNVSEKRTEYFDKLQSRLNEIKELKSRLSASPGSALLNFINDLERRIKQTIDEGVMDYNRQKVFDDAIQLLYLGEELIKLDPGTDLSTNPQITKKMTETNKKFVNSFGVDDFKGYSGGSNPGATVFDVYKEWKLNDRIKYHVRLADVEVMKSRLIKNSTSAQLDGMFKRELYNAAQAYNFGQFELALLSFEEIRHSYKQVGTLDDVQYYIAECNYLLGRYIQAETEFKKLVANYPSSSYIASTYKRLIGIDSHFERYNDAIDDFRHMQSIVSPGDDVYQEALLMTIEAALQGGLYQDAVSLAYEITPESPYYISALYVQGQALAGSHNLDDANKVFQKILSTPGLEPEMRFDVLAKLGFINYELGQPEVSIKYFDQIGGSYSKYDEVLLGYGWAYYKLELGKKVMESRDFSKAKQNLQLLISNYTNSDYNLEARTLLGYINQLEFNTTGAIENFRYAYNSKDSKLLSDDLNQQQERLETVMKTGKELEKEALEKRNLEAFNRAVAMQRKVEGPLFRLKYSDLSPVGNATKSQVDQLKAQLAELDTLKTKALAKNDKVIIKRIEKMQLKIYRAINSVPELAESPLGFNYFDEHPLARKESVVEFENKKLSKMRNDTHLERDEIVKKIARLEVEIINARSRQDYKKMANLEISKQRFEDLLDKLDYVESWVYSIKLHDTNINLARWSDYGAFGLANVNFAIRNYQKEQVGQMREQIQQINDLLIKRKANVENKINQIESEITLMTRRVRRQERIREREELNRQFEESYFDTHESESENNSNLNPPDNTAPPKPDNTAPPKFDNEKNPDQ